MRGNHLFSIFSPEKLKKVIPPHRLQGSEEPRCGGITFSAFSAPENRGSREEPRCGGITFSAFSALKNSKR